MFHGLRWRIIFVFGLIMMVVVAFSGVFAIWTTSNQFEELVTEAGLEQAAEIAVLLEARYNLQGDLSPDALEDVFFEEEEEFADHYDDWDRIIAEELGLSPDKYDKARYKESIIDLAEHHAVEPRVLVSAIMRSELQIESKEDPDNENGVLEEGEIPNAREKLLFLVESLYKVKEYVNDSLPILEEMEIEAEERTYFLDTLLEDSRVFITDETGVVLFDHPDEELNGERLDDEIMALGEPIHDWQDGRAAGRVIIAAGEGFYPEDEDFFLRSVRRLLFIGGLIAAVMALIVGAVFAYKITAPVTALTDAAKRLARGDHATPLPVTSKDELGEMSQAFNTLTQTIETQMALRRRLIADISHELNTPLSVIQLEMKALRDGLQSSSEASAQVEQEINLLRGLAKDLALLADTDKGDLPLDLEATDISAFMETTVSRWQARAESGGVTFQLDTAANLPSLSVDPARLSQAVGNIIDNGLRHTASGGQIVVTCRVGTFPEKKGEWVIMSIRDTGCGIDPEDLPFVFERFYRADHSRRRQGGGRGLGLSIVEQIITLHGGVTWAESQPDVGSAFFIALPAPSPDDDGD